MIDWKEYLRLRWRFVLCWGLFCAIVGGGLFVLFMEILK